MEQAIIDCPCDYRLSFEDEKTETLEAIFRWQQQGGNSSPWLEDIESAVAIKNSQRAITCENRAFRDQMLSGRSGIGLPFEHACSNLDNTSLESDKLLLEGVCSLEVEYLGRWTDGRTCKIRTYKRRLDELKNHQYAILIISRISQFVEQSDAPGRRNLAVMQRAVQQLDQTDYAICLGIASGDNLNSIADNVGLTRRSVEMRRQKIMNSLGLKHPVEIVKLLVRLEENGLIADRF